MNERTTYKKKKIHWKKKKKRERSNINHKIRKAMRMKKIGNLRKHFISRRKDVSLERRGHGEKRENEFLVENGQQEKTA